MVADGPSRMVKRPTGSGGEPSSPNCVASAGVKARLPLFLVRLPFVQAAISAHKSGAHFFPFSYTLYCRPIGRQLLA